MLHVHVPLNVFDLKMGFRSQKLSTTNSQTPQDVPEQTKMILQDIRKKTIQPHINYKAYYHKQT